MADAVEETAEVKPAAPEFRDLGTLLRSVIVLLVLCGIAAVVALILRGFEYLLLVRMANGEFATTADMAAAASVSDTRVQIASGGRAIFFVLAAIPFGMWIYRATKNLRALGAANLTVSPGWAVGSYFVPIVNFFAPYLAMREIWRASLDPGNWPAARSTPLLGWWWFLWLTNTISGSVATGMLSGAKDVEAAKAASLVAAGQNMIQIALCAVAILLLRRITANQLWQARLFEVF